MRVIDPGHYYGLSVLDAESEFSENEEPEELLRFVKREGPGYPGNVGHHAGTTIQEVLRACISRLTYLDAQITDRRNHLCINHLRSVLILLEHRAAERHGRVLNLDDKKWDYNSVESLPVCPKCLHIDCPGDCHA